jgi:hypothetical protein
MDAFLIEGIEDASILLECVPYGASQLFASFLVGRAEEPMDLRYFLRSDIAFLVKNFKRIVGNATFKTVFQKVKLYRIIKAMEAEGKTSESSDIQTPGYTMIKNLVDWMNITTIHATEYMDSVRIVALWHDAYVEEEERKLAEEYAALQEERAAFFQQKAASNQISELVLDVCPSYRKAVKHNYKPSEQQWDNLFEKLRVEVPRVKIISHYHGEPFARYQEP